jgi:predicted enzyme related to lactoylglutathione lyase
MSDSQGKFVWYELTTTDVKGAIRFYRDVIGWTTEPFGDAYVIWKTGETGIGGLTASRDSEKPVATPHWMGYVFADDVDALTKKAQSLGAKTHVPPADIPTVGRFSVIADPQGAVIALFTPLPRESSPPPAEPADGHVSWHELMTDDPEAAFRFYAALVGWQKTDAVESPMGTYQMYGQAGRTYGGMARRPKDYPAPPHWLYYVKVGDLDGALARVKNGGGRVMHGPMEVPGGDRVAQCVDPQGAAFALHGK